MTTLDSTSRTKLNRLLECGIFDVDAIHSLPDSTPMCHVAYIFEGKPAIVPTLQWREGERVNWHGSTGANSHLGGKANEVCLNVCQFDGLVLARSAFHHSANYRYFSLHRDI
jgi:nitroimidazol reductase NimA-like FMN-containing flavoprotein (pyridoxamine 5'-phosphate oxidase superfamily)